MTRAFLILAILGLLSATSCQTYKRSFGTTYTSYKEAQNKTIYRLDLSYQNLTEAPDFLDKCEDLIMLNLSGNTALDIAAFFKGIPNPEQLEILILDSLQLEKIPESIARFTHLKQLSINHNPTADFNQIFETLAPLPLEFLNLQGNAITELSPQIVQLHSLQSINLSHNSLAAGINYERLSQLPQLESLWLTSNNLGTLPPEIGLMSSLRNLYIEHNNLSELPEEMSQLSKVWILHAGHNNFKELPVVFTKMKGLLLLHANNNGIEKIPENYAQDHYSLVGLVMNYNALSETDIARWTKEFSGFFLASF